MDEKNNNLTTKKVSNTEKEERSSVDLDRNIKKEYPKGKEILNKKK
jgi:hypothetical protein